jgi:hypothetical protein
MVFVELPIFIRCAASLFTDEFGGPSSHIVDPAAGDLIKEGRGITSVAGSVTGARQERWRSVIVSPTGSLNNSAIWSMPTQRMWLRT